MQAAQQLLLIATAASAAVLTVQAGVVFGLVGTAVLAPLDYPRFDPRAAEGRAAMFVPARRSGSQVAGPPTEPSPALAAVRARILEVHRDFLRRERHASAILDRYRPTVTRPGGRLTPALVNRLTRTARAYDSARTRLAAITVPDALADAHAATLRMLEEAARSHREVIAAGRRRDPEFALAREPGYLRALSEHYVTLAALRAVPVPGTQASVAPAGS